MKKTFAPALTLSCLLLAACAQFPAQPQPRPMFGPGSAAQPSRSVQTPRYPAASGAAYQAPAPVQTPPWQQPQRSSPPQHQAAVRGESLGSGATFSTVKFAGMDMEVVVFDSRQCVLKVIDQPTPNAGGGVIAQAMPYYRAVAGVNGGFFHPDFQPLGLLIAGGRKYGRFTDNKLLSGSVVVVNNEPYLVWNPEFLGDQGVTDLIQSGPRLVSGGRPVDRLDANKSAARTFIANDGKRTWAIGVVRGATLAGLANALATPGAIPGMQVERALNLDGGRSSAFWARTASGRVISQPGWSTVRNYLAVVPR